MRGKPDHRPWQGTVRGITPADAGKTMWIKPASPFVRDHPRGCGENFTPAAVDQYGNGITPADAGKTQRRFAANMA